jgi:hypothetical protein
LMVILKGINKILYLIQNYIINCFRVTKKLTQFFFHDVLDDDRNRLTENLVVGPNSGMYLFSVFFGLFKYILI